MATTLHAGSPAYPPPPSFSQESTTSSVNGFQRSHSAMNSFDAPQSSATTPTPTPPASRSQPNPYNYPQLNGIQNTSTSHSFPDNRSLAQQPPMLTAQKVSPIYTAVYSGVQVYEMDVDGLALMKRRRDGWMNATQMLKLAGVEKGKRTKVLEKEIMSGPPSQHEKVQGGYGKYQGTWISYDRAVQFAGGYGVLDILKPLLDYDMGPDGATTDNLNTPTKEQAMAAQRKRNMQNGSMDRISAQSPNGTFFKNISKSAADAVNAINKARFDSPAPRPGSSRPSNSFRRPSQQNDSQEYGGSSQHSMQSVQQASFRSSQLDPVLQQYDGPYSQDVIMNGDEPPRKRMKASFSQDVGHEFDTQMTDVAPIASFAANTDNLDYTVAGLPPLRQPTKTLALEKQQLLSSLFFDASTTDFSDHPALVRLSGEDLDIPIDSAGHTALHWSSTLARISLARSLVRKGASIYRLNTGGETALIRASMTTNNLDQGSFPELLELLGPTIEIRDARGRTVLHQIAMSSAIPGPKRSTSGRYYLEALLEYIVRSGSATNSQANSFVDHNGHLPKPIGLARFMSEIVNATDISGDTALNLAARIGNRNIIQQLLEVGANPTVPNHDGLRPMDFGVAGDLARADGDAAGQQIKKSEGPKSRVTETSSELVNVLKSLVTDTETSFNAQMREKQSLIDSTNAKIKHSTALLAEERARLDSIRRKAERRKHLRQRVANLRQANEQMKTHLIRSAPPNSVLVSEDIKIGEADAGLEIDENIIPSTFKGATNLQLTLQQKQYVASMRHSAILRARKGVYKRLNERLEGEKLALRSQSWELEQDLRKIVGICCRMGEDRVDEMVEGLAKSVGNERIDEGEMGRVREFLRRMEGATAAG